MSHESPVLEAVTTPKLHGLVPDALRPRTHQVLLEDMELMLDIGFHEFEIGNPQRLLVTIEIWLDAAHFAPTDAIADAWNYDVIHNAVSGLVRGRRFNLQETVVREVYQLVAARQGVTALRVSSRKPDVYRDCRAVGVSLASF